LSAAAYAFPASPLLKRFMSHLRVSHEHDSASIVLDNPETENKLTVADIKAVIQALRKATDEGSLFLVIRFLVLDFCPGRDQTETDTGLTRQASLSLILEANTALHAFPCASIAAGPGRAFGFGMDLAVKCELRYASTDAEFAFDSSSSR